MLFSNGLLVTTVKMKIKHELHVTTELLFYILQKVTLTKVAYFLKLYYPTSFW